MSDRVGTSSRLSERGTAVRALVAIVVGILLGLAAAHAPWLKWWTLLPWGAAAFALGRWAGPRSSAGVGGLYGGALALAFLISSYSGPARVPQLSFLSVLGFAGAGCGAVLGFAGAPRRKRAAPVRGSEQ